ncbi:MAG: PP2C family protein-serine/threonine phosphatase [Lachnospirales bacterium]
MKYSLIIILAILGIVLSIVLVVILIRMINKRIWENRNKRRMAIIAAQGEDANTIVGTPFMDVKDDIYVYASQIIGTRNEQQDSYFISDSVEFDLLHTSYAAASVCDGMGGLSSGEVASKMAVDYARMSFHEYFDKPGLKNIPDFLKNVAINLNKKVYQYSIDSCGGQMCGTTMTYVILENNNLYWLSIGDSRIYIIRDKQIVQITNDHNYSYLLDQKVKEGIMSADEAMREANREALISYIGIENLDIIDLSVNPFRLEKGDIVLLCSDGLTKVLSDNEICEYINNNKENLEEMTKLLPLYAFDRNAGSQDNTTVAIVCYR